MFFFLIVYDDDDDDERGHHLHRLIFTNDSRFFSRMASVFFFLFWKISLSIVFFSIIDAIISIYNLLYTVCVCVDIFVYIFFHSISSYILFHTNFSSISISFLNLVKFLIYPKCTNHTISAHFFFLLYNSVSRVWILKFFFLLNKKKKTKETISFFFFFFDLSWIFIIIRSDDKFIHSHSLMGMNRNETKRKKKLLMLNCLYVEPHCLSMMMMMMISVIQCNRMM